MRKNQYDKYVADTGGKMSKDDWDSIKTDAGRKSVYDTAMSAKRISNASSGSGLGSTIILDQKSEQTLKRILNLTDENVSAQEKSLTLQSLAVEMINKEGKIRKTIVQDLGQVGELQTRNV